MPSTFGSPTWSRRSSAVLAGLNQSDSYATVRAKADAVYHGFASRLGVNTVRLPVNTHTVGSSWWNAYRGTIDAAAAKGFKVILAYWEDGAASGGRVTNTAAFDSMWNTVTAQYGSNSLVYFEPMNEPHGYSTSAWTNLAASWINARPSIPRGRILVGGTGYSQDIRPVCADSRLNGTLLSYHHYAFFYGTKDYAGWTQSFRERLGNCAARAVLTEFGAPMDTGLNYNSASSTNNFVRYLRADTDSLRDLRMGSVYWPQARLGLRLTVPLWSASSAASDQRPATTRRGDDPAGRVRATRVRRRGGPPRSGCAHPAGSSGPTSSAGRCAGRRRAGSPPPRRSGPRRAAVTAGSAGR